MSYTALYRKFRPDNFSDVKGQDHIVTTLTNQIKHNRIGHAYLFCGTRGTGKTTVAKILAKAVNCEHPVDGSPCNQCAMCKAIQAGTAAWMYIAVTQYMLGIRAKWDGLEIDPCLPKELLPAKVTRVFRGKKYNITITKNEKIFIKDDDKNVNVVI